MHTTGVYYLARGCVAVSRWSSFCHGPPSLKVVCWMVKDEGAVWVGLFESALEDELRGRWHYFWARFWAHLLLQAASLGRGLAQKDHL